jgi:hypothetical protein
VGTSSSGFRLFFIIVLGEVVLTTGTPFVAEPFSLERLLALTIGFAGSVALWWCKLRPAASSWWWRSRIQSVQVFGGIRMAS